ncbi:MAG: DUF3352 domain-containing protein [Nocardioidaceae bacterium]
MAGSTPPPGTPDPPDRPVPPPPTYDWVAGPGGGPGEPATPGSDADGQRETPQQDRRGARPAPVVLVLALVLALAVGGGAFAFFTVDPFHLFRPGPQAAEGLPADAVLYAGVDLDPTAVQKIDALRFLNHFPGFRDNAGVTDSNADVRRVLGTKLIDSMGCSDLDYGHDVEPWIGQRFGYALMPSTPDERHPFAVAVQVSDEDAAREAIAALESCGAGQPQPGVPQDAGVAFANGYLVLSQTQRDADAYASAAREHSLADDPKFSADVDSLGDAGVATMWVDVLALVSDLDSGSALGDVSDLTSAAQRVAATVRFGSDHVEVATSVFGDTPAVDHGDNPVVHLPDSTVFAVSESGAAERLARAWSTSIADARARNVDVDKQIADFETKSGLSLPGDLETILGHNIMVALDGEGLTADALAGGDPSSINAGARFTNDPEKLDAVYDRLLGLVDSEVDQAMPFVKKDVSDGLVIATNEGYADKLGALDGTLGESDVFRSVVDDGAGQEFVLFFDFAAIREQVISSLRESGAPAEVIDNLLPVRAFGMTGNVEGDYVHTTIRVSVDD